MKAPLLFDPTGGVFFDTKTNEGTKLTKLGSEGRSTSTTITVFSILSQLKEGKVIVGSPGGMDCILTDSGQKNVAHPGWMSI